ncbi:MAG TPA: P1 family peptidase [Rhizomicrobium sp.]
MITAGRKNLITDVAGLKIGNAEDERVRSGVTVLIGDRAFGAVIDIRGASPGTRDTSALNLTSVGFPVDALVLAGGSLYGLDAVSGVLSHLRSQGRGYTYEKDIAPLPMVPGAILFDLTNGGDKDWGDVSPYAGLGRRAAQSASEHFRLGNAGAGYGARAGQYKGGLGSASAVLENGRTVGALAAVNSVGSPVIPGTDVLWAYALEQDREFGGRSPRRLDAIDLDLPADMKSAPSAGANTTLAVVATDAPVSRAGLQQIAIMATDGFARALRPAHTPFDGDLVFAVSTETNAPDRTDPVETMLLGHVAADCVARAIARGVYEAETLGTFKSYRETFGRI